MADITTLSLVPPFLPVAPAVIACVKCLTQLMMAESSRMDREELGPLENGDCRKGEDTVPLNLKPQILVTVQS